MRSSAVLILAIPALCISASAAAADLSEGYAGPGFVPGVHLSFSFGGSPGAAPPFDLHETTTDPAAPAPDTTSGMSSTTTWIIIGVALAAVVVIAASNHGGGSNGGY